MTGGWRHRVTSITGTAVPTALAIGVANVHLVQQTFARVPSLGRPAPAVLSSGDLLLAVDPRAVISRLWQVGLGCLTPLTECTRHSPEQVDPEVSPDDDPPGDTIDRGQPRGVEQ